MKPESKLEIPGAAATASEDNHEPDQLINMENTPDEPARQPLNPTISWLIKNCGISVCNAKLIAELSGLKGANDNWRSS